MNFVSKLFGRTIEDNKINSLILEGWNDTIEPYHTGVDLCCDESTDVYSVYRGVVVYVGIRSGRYMVTIELDSYTCIRYGNLRSINVRSGQIIDESVLIGQYDKYIRVEYCSRNVAGRMWPVRIGKVTYYKQDPTPLISGEKRLYLSNYSGVQVDNSIEYTDTQLTQSQIDEISGVRGDRVVEF